MYRPIAGWCLASLTTCATAASVPELPALHEIGRSVPGFESAGSGRFAVADFDGDGAEDIVLPATNGTALFQVIGQKSGTIQVKQTVLLEDEAFVRVMRHDADGAPHLLTLATNGTLREFSGWPLKQIRQLDLGVEIGPSYGSSAAIGDIDADGDDELVVTSDGWVLQQQMLKAYDLETGQLEWSSPNQYGRDLILQQLDGDAALEIVVAGTPGYIIDGATKANDWSYQDGFGVQLAGGHFQQGSRQFVAARDSNLFTVFQSGPYSPLWDAYTFWDIHALATADLDGDGLDEIILGGQSPEIDVYDVRTQQVRLFIANEGSGLNAIASADIVGDGIPMVAFSPRQTWRDEGWFHLVDANSGATLWKIGSAEPGPYTPVALGDTDRDGAIEFLYGAQGNSYTQSIVSQVDVMTGSLEWVSPPSDGGTDPTYDMIPQSLQVARRAGGAPKIIVAGNQSYGKILAIDGISHDVSWQSGINDGDPIQHKKLADIAIFDIDADGNDEVIACTIAAYPNTMSGVRLFVLSSADGSVLWQSVAMGVSYESCKGVMAGVFDDSSRPLLAAVLPTSIRAFDAQTHLLAWTLPVAAEGATLLESGPSGREFAVFSETQLSIYDGATRTLLRQFDLGAPISAVREITGDAKRLLVAAGGRLRLIDGISGSPLASSDFLGNELGGGNQLAAKDLGGGTWLIGAGSRAGVFRYLVQLTDAIFASGFEVSP